MATEPIGSLLGEVSQQQQPKTTNSPTVANLLTIRRSDLAIAGVPPMYRDATSADFVPAIRQRITTPNDNGYFITGPTGTGKTHLAVAILRWWMERRLHQQGPMYFRSPVDDRDVLCWEAKMLIIPKWFSQIKATFDGIGSAAEMAEQATTAHVLVLDDYGAEKSSDFTGDVLYQVIACRINNQQPTVVTSNLSLREIHVDKQEPRMASRLGGLTEITLAGADRRLK